MQEQVQGRPCRAADDRGVALLVVLAVVAVLAVVVLDFSFSVRVDMHVAANFRDRLVALEAAKAGVNYGIYLLRQDDPGQDNLQEDWGQLSAIVLDKTDPELMVEESMLSEEELAALNHEDFLARQKEGNVPTATILICDEERKINVNLLSNARTRSTCRQWIENLIENMEYPGVDPAEIVDNIIDWIDTDDDGEAEYSYYEELPRPYSCRNDNMESIYELKMVKGVNDLLFFGNTPYPMQLSGLEEDQWDERQDLGYTLPGTPPWEREKDPDSIYGLVNFLTAQSSSRINLKTAPPEVLQAIFDNDEFLAETIVDAREQNPLQTKEITNMINQVSPSLNAILVQGGLTTSASSYFRIESTGKFHRSAVKVTAIVSRARARDITITYWRVEDTKPDSSSEDVAWANVI